MSTPSQAIYEQLASVACRCGYVTTQNERENDQKRRPIVYHLSFIELTFNWAYLQNSLSILLMNNNARTLYGCQKSKLINKRARTHNPHSIRICQNTSVTQAMRQCRNFDWQDSTYLAFTAP